MSEIKKNDRLTLVVDGATHDGAGVAHADGAAVFVPDAAAGDVIEAKIVKCEKNFYRGKLLSVLAPSPDRIAPLCPAFGRCGGCCYQHITYEAELALKQRRVEDCIRRIGGLELSVNKITGADATEKYRNKAQFPIGADADGRPLCGFYARRSHRIIEADCAIQKDCALAARDAALLYLEQSGEPPYDERSGRGLFRHLFVRSGQGGVQVMAVINGRRIADEAAFVGLLRERVPELCSVVLNFNTQKGNVILGRETRTIFGADALTDVLCGRQFEISSLSFYQVNRDMCERLYGKAREYAALDSGDVLVDLYCGVGTIGLCIGGRAQKIVGVEIVPQAVENARRNALLNGYDNAKFYCGAAEQTAAQLAKDGIKPAALLLDPPRKGCDAALIAAAKELSPERIVYISCNPATLARDLARFAEIGYAAAEIAPFDLFPRTEHVETAVLLCRKKSG